MASAEALITADLLVWARESLGLKTVNAAEHLGVDEDRLIGWEQGLERPSVAQLRKIANFYKRPFSSFYLAARPAGASKPRDLRRIHGHTNLKAVTALHLAIRNAEYYRECSFELRARSKQQIPPFRLEHSSSTNPLKIAADLRNQLDISYQEQATWRDERIAYNNWRNRLEHLGVLVLQFSEVSASEARGFSIYHDELPIIAINSHDAYAARTFTLFHELAHIVYRQSGICDIHEDSDRATADQNTEVFCNAVAGNFLVPAELLDRAIVDYKFSLDNFEHGLRRLAKTFSVSRAVLLRRLFDRSKISKALFEDYHQQLIEEHLLNERRKKERQQGQEIKISRANAVVSDLGLRYVGLVLQQYRAEQISLKSAAEYFGAKPKHLDRIETLFQARLLSRGATD